MADTDVIQDMKERLIRIETLLEQKFLVTEDRIKKLEDNQMWLWRAIVGAVIAGAIAFFFKF